MINCLKYLKSNLFQIPQQFDGIKSPLRVVERFEPNVSFGSDSSGVSTVQSPPRKWNQGIGLISSDRRPFSPAAKQDRNNCNLERISHLVAVRMMSFSLTVFCGSEYPEFGVTNVRRRLQRKICEFFLPLLKTHQRSVLYINYLLHKNIVKLRFNTRKKCRAFHKVQSWAIAFLDSRQRLAIITS